MSYGKKDRRDRRTFLSDFVNKKLVRTVKFYHTNTYVCARRYGPLFYWLFARKFRPDWLYRFANGRGINNGNFRVENVRGWNWKSEWLTVDANALHSIENTRVSHECFPSMEMIRLIFRHGKYVGENNLRRVRYRRENVFNSICQRMLKIFSIEILLETKFCLRSSRRVYEKRCNESNDYKNEWKSRK